MNYYAGLDVSLEETTTCYGLNRRRAERTKFLARATWIVPVGTMGEAIPLRA